MNFEVHLLVFSAGRLLFIEFQVGCVTEFMEGRSVRSIRHMYHEFLDGRRSESNADWVATRTESTWSAFWYRLILWL